MHNAFADRKVAAGPAVLLARPTCGFSVGDDYQDWVDRYEGDAESKMRSDDRRADLIGLYSRSGVTAQKLAVIFQVSRCPQLRVTPEAVNDAITFLEYVHRATAKIAISFADTWSEKQQNRVMDFIIKRGGRVKREDLYRYMKLDSRKLDGVMMTLREQGRVEISREKTSGRPAVVYTFVE